VKRVLLFGRAAPYRAILRRLIEAEHDLAVVAETGRAEEAVRLVAAHQASVAIVDLSVDGAELDLIETLMRSTPLPILVLTSGDPAADPLAFEVVRRGAVDLMPRPTGGDHAAAARLRQRLRLVAGVPVIRHTRPTPVPEAPETRASAIREAGSARSRPRIIGLAASAGGASAVAAIVARFDVAFPAAVAVVQHLPDRFASTFASFLRQSAALPVEVVTSRVGRSPGGERCAARRRSSAVGHGVVSIAGARLWRRRCGRRAQRHRR
jgi:chemotaxis response regulator CheB